MLSCYQPEIYDYYSLCFACLSDACIASVFTVMLFLWSMQLRHCCIHIIVKCDHFVHCVDATAPKTITCFITMNTPRNFGWGAEDPAESEIPLAHIHVVALSGYFTIL